MQKALWAGAQELSQNLELKKLTPRLATHFATNNLAT